MQFLITAGNTWVLIDKVRCITNIFSGRTGAHLALEAYDRGHHVTLLTSRPEAIAELRPATAFDAPRWSVRTYQTFDNLQDAMHAAVVPNAPDAVVHCAAVSDYRAAGIFAPAAGTTFDGTEGIWHAESGKPTLVDRQASKVKSDEPELWLRLIRTPKIIDRLRTEWGFAGMLIKFKLEVGLGEDELLRVAELSRWQSDADLMVANTLEGAREWALVGPLNGKYERVDRASLPGRVIGAIETLHGGQSRG